MADIITRPYELTNEPSPSDDVSILIDNASFVEPKQSTLTQLLGKTEADRDAMDNAIIAGSGLESDGKMQPVVGSAYLKNTDFVAAGKAVDLKNGLSLLDTAIKSIGQSQSMYVHVNLTSAEIKQLFTTPLEKILPPDLGAYYSVKSADFKINFNSIPYAWSGELLMQFTGKSDYICKIAEGDLELSVTKRLNAFINSHEIVLNSGIEFVATSANPTTGDGTIDVMVEYVMRPDFTGVPVTPGSNCCMIPLVDSFDSTNMSMSGNLVITHNLNTIDVFVIIQDQNGAFVASTFATGDELGANKPNIVTVSGLGVITGVWRYLIFGKPV